MHRNSCHVGSEGLKPYSSGYHHDMKTVVIILIVVVALAIVAALVKRQANQKSEALRHQAQEHRDQANASRLAATRQETEANAMAAKARDDLAIAERQSSAAAVKREVADDLVVRADSIDPDVTNTPTGD